MSIQSVRFSFVILVLALLSAVACYSPSDPESPIKSFSAEKSKIKRGDSAKLVAVFDGTGEIDHEIGSIESGVAVDIASLNETTTFTLTVTTEAGRSFTQTVDLLALDPPTIKSFQPEKVIRPGQETKLIAVFENGTGTVDGNIGAIASNEPKSTGIVPATKEFTLTVTNEVGSVTATTEVEAAVTPVITSFEASAPVVPRYLPTALSAVFVGGKGTIAGVGPIKSNTAVATPKVPRTGATYTLTVTNGFGESVSKTVSVTTKKELFVTDYGADVLVFDVDAQGNAPPKRVISTEGGPTGIVGLTVVNDELFIANENDVPSVTVYNVSDEGAVAPKRRIAGPATTIDGGYMFSVANGEIYLADKSSKIKVWNLTATGNVAPKRVLAGGATGLDNALATSVVGGELYVSNFAAGEAVSSVTVYPQGAAGNATPTRKFNMPTPTGLLVSGNELFVNNREGEITVYNKQTGAQLRKIAGPLTQLSELYQCSLSDGELFCASFGNDRVLVFPASANGNVAPKRVIVGEKTFLTTPASVYVY